MVHALDPGPQSWVPAQPVKAQMINTVFAGTPPNDPGRLLAQGMWDTCQAHASNPNDPNDFQELFFLPWHRFFVYYFEEIIRSVLNDNAFTLPYWNYLSADPNDKIMPSEFRDPQSPLFVQNRNPWANAGQPIDSDRSALQSTNNCFRETLYSRFCPAIDGRPSWRRSCRHRHHNEYGLRAHGRTDPIFWIHHCEIDRLWESWNRIAGRNNPVWPDRSFVYADAAGNAVIRKCKDADRVALLGYQYDSYYTPPFAVAAAPPGPMAAAFTVVEETTRALATGPLQIAAGGSRITLQPPPELALSTASLQAAAVKQTLFRAVASPATLSRSRRHRDPEPDQHRRPYLSGPAAGSSRHRTDGRTLCRHPAILRHRAARHEQPACRPPADLQRHRGGEEVGRHGTADTDPDSHGRARR